jgi:hypothetical protein
LSTSATGLDEALLNAWQAMKSQRWATALDALNLPPEPERPGAMARLHAFRAQASFELGKLEEAEKAAAAAVTWAKKEPGQAGLAPLRALQARILTSHAATKPQRLSDKRTTPSPMSRTAPSLQALRERRCAYAKPTCCSNEGIAWPPKRCRRPYGLTLRSRSESASSPR